MVAHALNPSAWEAEAEVEASLVYVVSPGHPVIHSEDPFL